ncbi:DedA family protein [Oryzihumus leptocrescens]|uniref:DedA family protein n=1 Tax=Oryzihumus leptocrescens TaxID=297536 RepID=UPI0031E36288
MSRLLDQILSAPTAVVLTVVGLLVFAEDALFIGFVLPGETAAILGGVAANRGHVPLIAVIDVVVAAAILGDTVGYEVARHFGGRVIGASFLDKRRDRIDAAQTFLAERGGWAVFLGRWIAFFRAVMPALAGTSRMPYLKFLSFNAAGGLLWGTAVVTAGYLAGSSYSLIEKVVGRDAAFVALGVALIVLVVWRVRRHRAERTTRHD